MFSEISQSETKLKINWIVRDMNNIIIGNIEQERVISKNLIKNFCIKGCTINVGWFSIFFWAEIFFLHHSSKYLKSDFW